MRTSLRTRGVSAACFLRCRFLLRGRRNERDFGFGKEVALALAGYASVSGKCKPDGEHGHFIVRCGVDGGQQSLSNGALFVLVLPCKIVGKVVRERVGVEVDDSTKQDAQLCWAECCGGVCDDALEALRLLVGMHVNPLAVLH